MNSYSIRQNEQNFQYELWNGRFQTAAPQTSLPHQLAYAVALKAPWLAKQAWRGADIVASGGVSRQNETVNDSTLLVATVASSSGNGRYAIHHHFDELGQPCGQSCECPGYSHGSAPCKGIGNDPNTPMCVHLMAAAIFFRIEAGRAPMTATSLRQDKKGDLSPAAERAFIAAGITPIRPLTDDQKAAVAQRKAAWRRDWDATLARQEAARRQPDAIGPALANVRRTDGRIIGRQQWEDAKVVAVITDPATAAALLGLND